jgi:hypothetical protein
MSHDYIEMAQQLRARAARNRRIRQREIVVLALFAGFTLFFALIG